MSHMSYVINIFGELSCQKRWIICLSKSRQPLDMWVFQGPFFSLIFCCDSSFLTLSETLLRVSLNQSNHSCVHHVCSSLFAWIVLFRWVSSSLYRRGRLAFILRDWIDFCGLKLCGIGEHWYYAARTVMKEKQCKFFQRWNAELAELIRFEIRTVPTITVNLDDIQERQFLDRKNTPLSCGSLKVLWCKSWKIRTPYKSKTNRYVTIHTTELQLPWKMACN